MCQDILSHNISASIWDPLIGMIPKTLFPKYVSYRMVKCLLFYTIIEVMLVIDISCCFVMTPVFVSWLVYIAVGGISDNGLEIKKT